MATLNIKPLADNNAEKRDATLRDVQRELIQDASLGEVNFENIERYKNSIVEDFARLSKPILGANTELTTALRDFLVELDLLLKTGSEETAEENIRKNVKKVNSDMSIEATFEILRVLTKRINGRQVFTSFRALNDWMAVHARNMPDLIQAVEIISNRELNISNASEFQSSDLSEHIDYDGDYFKEHQNDLNSSEIHSKENTPKTLAIIVLFIHAAYMYMQYFRAVCAPSNDKSSKDRINPDTPRAKVYDVKSNKVSVEFPNPLLAMDELLQGILNISVENEVLENNGYKAAFEIYKDLYYAIQAAEILAYLESNNEINNVIVDATENIRTKLVGETKVFRQTDIKHLFEDTLKKIISISEGQDLSKIKIALIQKFQETLLELNCDRTKVYTMSAQLGLIDLDTLH